MTSLDSFRCCKTLKVGSKTYAYFRLPAAENLIGTLTVLPPADRNLRDSSGSRCTLLLLQ